MTIDYLRTLRTSLDRGDSRIVIDYPLRFTKGETQHTRCELFVDQALQKNVNNWIESCGGLPFFLERYSRFDPRLLDTSWPAHFPVHILRAEGQITEGRNIFMFFPEVLGVSTALAEDYFGLELVDVWSAVFDQIISPCVQRVCDEQTQFSYFEAFCTQRSELIYLASVFHEIGHRVGPWKVSPCKDESINLSQMQVDIMGELSTDTYLIKFLPEFPELASFVLYQRLFWFGRMQYDIDPVHGALNTDNDCWIGAYLWKIAEQVGCLTHNEATDKWHIAPQRIAAVFDVVFEELDRLGDWLPGTTCQVEALQGWIDQQVPRDQDGQFIYPPSMARALSLCGDVPTRVRIHQPLKV